MNAVSSRSHCVFMLYISGEHAPSGTRLQGCLCLVDLAGSERLDRSLAEAERGAFVVGRGPVLAVAQEAGCDAVMPRSAFSQNLPQLLRRHGAPAVHPLALATAF